VSFVHEIITYFYSVNEDISSNIKKVRKKVEREGFLSCTTCIEFKLLPICILSLSVSNHPLSLHLPLFHTCAHTYTHTHTHTHTCITKDPNGFVSNNRSYLTSSIMSLPSRKSEESIAHQGHRSDGPVDLDGLYEQEEHSSTADRWRISDGPADLDELYEHEQEQYTSSFRPVSHNSIVFGKNNNVSLPHCRTIAATNSNTSNNSHNNINGTINGKNNVQSNNSTIIDSFPRLLSMLDEPMNDKLRDWARRHQNIYSSSGSGSGSNSIMSNSRSINASRSIIMDTINGSLDGSSSITCEKVYPADTYSSLSLYGPIKNPRLNIINNTNGGDDNNQSDNAITNDNNSSINSNGNSNISNMSASNNNNNNSNLRIITSSNTNK
jgi:hypothetical protein